MPNKTYIFFGTNSPMNSSRNTSTSFSYVCFEKNNNVYFIKKGEFNKEIPLYEFTNIDALEDLISFILLRRMISETEKNFEEIILQEAKSRIKILKINKISDKMLITAYPSSYYNNGDRLKHLRITTLPISPNPIRSGIPIDAS